MNSKLYKRVLMVLCALLQIFSFNIIASANQVINTTPDPTISLASVSGKKEDIVEVCVSLSNNPGLASVSLEIEFDSSALELVTVTDTGLLTGQMHTDVLSSPYTLTWANDLIKNNITANGVIAKLSFKVLTDTVKDYDMKCTIPKDGIYNVNAEMLDFKVENGKVTVLSSSHVCKFDKKVCKETYIKSSATCTTNATYYYSCECGAKGTKTFIVEGLDFTNHAYSHVFNWSSYSIFNVVLTCSNCSSETKDHTMNVSCVIECTEEKNSLTFTATATINNTSYTDTQKIVAKRNGDKFDITISLVNVNPSMNMNLILSAYDVNGKMTGSQSAKAVNETTSFSVPKKGSTYRLFFLNSQTYVPLLPALSIT